MSMLTAALGGGFAALALFDIIQGNAPYAAAFGGVSALFYIASALFR